MPEETSNGSMSHLKSVCHFPNSDSIENTCNSLSVDKFSYYSSKAIFIVVDRVTMTSIDGAAYKTKQ